MRAHFEFVQRQDRVQVIEFQKVFLALMQPLKMQYLRCPYLLTLFFTVDFSHIVVLITQFDLCVDPEVFPYDDLQGGIYLRYQYDLHTSLFKLTYVWHLSNFSENWEINSQ